MLDACRILQCAGVSLNKLLDSLAGSYMTRMHYAHKKILQCSEDTRLQVLQILLCLQRAA